jgi:hypothetical protein
MKQDVAAAADADSLAGLDLEVIEQGQHVVGCVVMTERLGECAGSAVTAEVGDDHLDSEMVAILEFYEKLLPSARRFEVADLASLSPG